MSVDNLPCDGDRNLKKGERGVRDRGTGGFKSSVKNHVEKHFN